MTLASTLPLVINALVAGLMLGSLYAAIAMGVTISFGMLNIVNIAHPAFVLAGSYLAMKLQARYGLDPFLSAVLLTPVFYFFGSVLYRVYHATFERRGGESLRGLVFFFGILFLVEATLTTTFGVDFRSVSTAYTDSVWRLRTMNIPLRLLLPAGVSVAMTFGLQYVLANTFFGRSVMAVGQDAFALTLMGTDPVKVKRRALGLSVATAALSGAMLVIVQPVQPTLGREYIGMVFAVCVLGGMGNLRGSLMAGLLLGLAETFTTTFVGPSWAPAASFGLLLLTLAFRPARLFV